MSRWRILVWASATAVFFVLTAIAGLWLFGTPTTIVVTQTVNGVTVVKESHSDYSELIVPGLFLAMALLGLAATSFTLWRTARSVR